MRRALVLAAILAAGVTAVAVRVSARAAQSQETMAFPPIGQIQKVRNNLYVIPDQGGNTAVFVTRTGVVLVDTKVANNGQAILERVAAVSDVPVTTIINTHTHADHVGSNSFFAPSVEIVTQERTRARMEQMVEVRDSPNAMPDRTFRDRLTLGRGRDQVDLYYFGAGHTDGDAIVVFPGVRAMHAGDLFAAKMPPLIDPDQGGSGLAFPETLERAVKEIANVDTVIPGHAPVTTWAAFVEYARFTRELVTAVRAARQAGKTAEQAAAGLTLPAPFSDYIAPTATAGLEFLGTGTSIARENVATIYRELAGKPR